MAEKSMQRSVIDARNDGTPTNESKDACSAKTKPIMILVNPLSGRGNSLRTVNDTVLPMLKSFGFSYEMFVTETNVRVQDFLSEKNLSDLDQFKSIVVVSGDGLLHETINSILSRSDWRSVIEIPLGIIPSGSGNGMAYTLIRGSRPMTKVGKEAVKLCCEQALQGETCQIDLIEITYGKGSTIWSFLSFGWGLLSDIDVDSDWLRPLGEFRFTIYGILRAFTATSYQGRLSYRKKKPDNSQEVKCDISGDHVVRCDNGGLGVSRKNEEDWVHIEDRFACVYAVYQAHISSGTKFAPKSRLSDETIFLTFIRGSLSVVQTIKFLLAIQDGSHDKLSYVTVVPVDCFKLEPLEPSKIVIDGENVSWQLSDGPLTVGLAPKLIRLLWSLPPSYEAR